MKKTVVTVILMISLTGVGAAVFAQEQEGENGRGTGLFYINVAVDMVWPHRLGYVVQYRRPGGRAGRAYLPVEWFASAADGRGELVTLPAGPSWPSMSVFFRDGEFSHVRLRVHPSPSHHTWGFIPQNVRMESRFEGVETVELQF